MSTPSLPPLKDDDKLRPLVSVIMPAYNRAEFLRDSAQMILKQTYRNFELIISDDHSTDHTPHVAAELMALDPRVFYHRPINKGGISQVLNEAILISCGHYIQICHDHDIYVDSLLETLVDIMERNPSVVFVHPGIQWSDHLGTPLPHAYFVSGYPEVSEGLAWQRKMLSSLACPVTALSMIRRTALEQVGLFDPEFGFTTDVEMWLRLCTVGDVGYADRLLILVRGRDPAHPHATVNWQGKDEVIRAHRKYLSLSYSGWIYLYMKIQQEIRIDCSQLISFLASFRHQRRLEINTGRVYLRKHGVLLSRIASWALWIPNRVK